MKVAASHWKVEAARAIMNINPVLVWKKRLLQRLQGFVFLGLRFFLLPLKKSGGVRSIVLLIGRHHVFSVDCRATVKVFGNLV